VTQIDHLIRLANRIGQFFEAMPNRSAGLDGIADHIRHFWEPRMRRSLLDFLARHPDGRSDQVALSAICLEAIARHRDRLAVPSAGLAPGQPG
jgi:formate dehydrogenase subunit delta